MVSAKKEIERASLPASKVSHTGAMLFIINLNLNIQKASMGCPARSALGKTKGTYFLVTFMFWEKCCQNLLSSVFLQNKEVVCDFTVFNVFQGNYDG